MVTCPEDGAWFALAQKNGVVGFYPIARTIQVPEGKVYLNVQNPGLSVKGFLTFDFGDETGVSELATKRAVNGKWYNLAGQRVNHAQKGIFIVNGKKVVVK